MLDVTAVGADLTPEQQDETIADLTFFLDAFGSTQAVRAMLQEQKNAIQRLRRLQSLPLDERSQEDDKDRNHDEMSISTIAGEDVAQTMTDLDFFLKTFGSTRGVREKLQRQKLEIIKLESAIQEANLDSCDSRNEFSSKQRSRPSLSKKLQARSGEAKDDALWNARGSTGEVGSGENKEEPDGNAIVEVGRVTQSGDIDASERKEGGLAATTAPEVALDSSGCERKRQEDQEGSRRSPNFTRSSTAFMNDAVVVAYCATLARAKEMCATLQSSGATINGGIVQINACSATCKVKDCYRRAAADSLCWFHESASQCGFDGCERLAHLHANGYCMAHARQKGVLVKPKCNAEGCAYTQQRSTYCIKHYNIRRREAPASHLDGNSRFELTPSRSRVRRSHITCKVYGCLKWVMRDGNESKYCNKHRDAFEIHDAESKTQARQTNVSTQNR